MRDRRAHSTSGAVALVAAAPSTAARRAWFAFNAKATVNGYRLRATAILAPPRRSGAIAKGAVMESHAAHLPSTDALVNVQRRLSDRASSGKQMKSARSAVGRAPARAATGIIGFDEITGGGLPRSRTTLLVGGPGSGKTIFALQFLVHGAQHCICCLTRRRKGERVTDCTNGSWRGSCQ